jgi:hypothetical protein
VLQAAWEMDGRGGLSGGGYGRTGNDTVVVHRVYLH